MSPSKLAHREGAILWLHYIHHQVVLHAVKHVHG